MADGVLEKRVLRCALRLGRRASALPGWAVRLTHEAATRNIWPEVRLSDAAAFVLEAKPWLAARWHSAETLILLVHVATPILEVVHQKALRRLFGLGQLRNCVVDAKHRI